LRVGFGTKKPAVRFAPLVTRDPRLSAYRAIRCRIEPYWIKAAPLRGTAGAPATGLRVGDARPARARRQPDGHRRSIALTQHAERLDEPSSSPHYCPARGHRVNGGPAGPSHAIGYADH
jgi:hypothetical protein